MSRGGGTTLYVTGFGHGTRARDLAYEFERFAFVEYEKIRDADDAYYEMHNKRIGREDLLKIEWARTPPSASWRFDQGSNRDGGRDGGRGGGSRRERSPRRGRSGSPPRSRRYDDDRDRDYDRGSRRDDRDSRRDRDRTRSPDDRDRGADRDRGDRDRDLKERDREEDREERAGDREREREYEQNGTNGEERKGSYTLPFRARF
ncbi:hypothetical protein AC579_9169 [Pseudocercospora musae]|uniref:RRM domain-containing protein n=1 Tax=Pseudocercospora musae TaxID=113226 RepID=A0A139I7F1_9PEZI|nr:hypothetical protein AC579_9169 [Pseudocercospora musae]